MNVYDAGSKLNEMQEVRLETLKKNHIQVWIEKGPTNYRVTLHFHVGAVGPELSGKNATVLFESAVTAVIERLNEDDRITVVDNPTNAELLPASSQREVLHHMGIQAEVRVNGSLA